MSSIFREVIISSEITGQSWNTCIWDLHSATSLQTYKGGSAAPRTLNLIGRDYLLTAVTNKPLIHVWSLSKQDQVMMKMVCPGVVRALSTSPCGQYCSAAILSKIYIWQICTGELFGTVSGHYQNITCLKYSRDGSKLISGGDDGMVIVWHFTKVISGDCVRGAVHTWNHHSLPVTDLFVSHGCMTPRVLTSSMDHTCKMYDLISGALLTSFIFTSSVTSVVMNPTERRLIAGLSTGDLCVVYLRDQNFFNEQNLVSEMSEHKPYNKWTGHTKQVTCLSMSADGNYLVSGSQDCSVKVWDIRSGQCVQTINHKGAITNLMVIFAPQSVTTRVDKKCYRPIQTFKRILVPHSDLTDPERKSDIAPVVVHLSGLDQVKSRKETVCVDSGLHKEDSAGDAEISRNATTNWSDHPGETLDEMTQKVLRANLRLYQFSVDQILTDDC